MLAFGTAAKSQIIDSLKIVNGQIVMVVPETNTVFTATEAVNMYRELLVRSKTFQNIINQQNDALAVIEENKKKLRELLDSLKIEY